VLLTTHQQPTGYFTEPLTIDNSVPPHNHQRLQDLRDFLMLDKYRITVGMNANPHGEDCDGAALTSARYLWANVQFRPGSVDNNIPGRTLLAHEMLEVRFAEMGLAVNRILDMLPPDQREAALAIYVDAKEPTLESIARGVTRLMDELDRPR
jgi:hypothetical protein